MAVTKMENDDAAEDQVFQIRDGVWWCIVAGRVLGNWPDKGSALAGMRTEQRRAARARMIVSEVPVGCSGKWEL
jgi:hypothetical protein